MLFNPMNVIYNPMNDIFSTLNSDEILPQLSASRVAKQLKSQGFLIWEDGKAFVCACPMSENVLAVF